MKHFHPNCDCKIVPDWGGGIEGYDDKVDYYYDVYSHPEKHPEINEAINARRRELYREKHPKPIGDDPSGEVRAEGKYRARVREKHLCILYLAIRQLSWRSRWIISYFALRMTT